MIVYLLAILLAITLIVSFYRIKDLFSPVKFYILSLVIYFGDVFVSPQLTGVYYSYFIYILFGFILVFFEARILNGFETFIHAFRKLEKPELKNPIVVVITIFILSLIPIGAQLYLIKYMGGIEGFLISLRLRVEAWAGLGYIIIFRDLMAILNLVFFIIIILFKYKKRAIVNGAFIIHLLFTILIGLLSGSRSGVLYTLLFNLMVYHYMVRPLRLALLFALLPVFLIGAALLGTMREQFRLTDDEVTILTDDEDIIENSVDKTGTFIYGIIPLNIIFNERFEDYQYGLTYATTFTNYVPRQIWPSKPESGGIILTRFKYKGSYEGTTNYSTGLITEAIINFGYTLGYLVAFVILLGMAWLAFEQYRRLKRYIERHIDSIDNPINYSTIIRLVYYLIMFQQSIGSITITESNNLGFNIIKQIILFLLVDFVLLRFLGIKYEIAKAPTND